MSKPHNHEVLFTEGKKPIKAWIQGVELEDAAREQLDNVAGLPFIHKWIAAMPDVHWGMGATVGSVIPTKGAIVPAAVGVDLGCGMMAVQTTLTAEDLPALGLAVDAFIALPSGAEGARAAFQAGLGAHLVCDAAGLQERVQAVAARNPGPLVPGQVYVA